jgi:fatty acid desaturase
MTDQVNSNEIRNIVSGLRSEFEKIKIKYPIFHFRDGFGLFFFLISILAIFITVYFWSIQLIGSILLILIIAFFTSILHEIEHDLIHDLYFSKNRIIKNFMFFGVWIFRPLTLNPWLRRYWHIYHHQNSGQITDIEERGVTNGEKWSFLRFLITPDLVLGFVLRYNRIRKEINLERQKGNFSDKDMKMLKKIVLFGFLPFGVPLYIALYVWVILNVIPFFNIQIPSFLDLFIQNYLNPIMYILVLPNYFRQFCLHLITSNMHYYGDIEEDNIIQQTQILNVWWLFPLQLFCFNFGSTHGIHHFVVNEPFYLRQLIAKKAHEIMKRDGVRQNDIGSFFRSNRFNSY